MTFIQLQKNSKKDMSGLNIHRLAIISDCTTTHLSIAIKGYGYTKNLALEIFETEQVLDSHIYDFKPDTILIYMCSEKLYNLWCTTPEANRAVFAEDTLSRIKKYWQYLSARIIQFTFAENDDYVFGNYKHKTSYIYQLRKLNMLLMDENIALVDLCTIQSRLGRNNLFDPKLYYVAKMPISLTALPIIAANILDIILCLQGTVKKCVILDLDNTLWGGIIGDDGLSGIQIGDLGIGQAFSAFQIWLRELKKRGILLAVCSKNEENIAKEPFELHEDMILELDDFSMFIANWDDKVTNIRIIQESLNIGPDSIVFIDDNPFERELVRSMIPEITVPDMPDDPSKYLSFLQSLNLFETISYSEEDTKRTDYYRTQAQQVSVSKQYANYDDYLQSLDMFATAAPFDDFHIPRIAQLTQRSNQFNLRTIRYTESEIAEIMNTHITLYFTLKDKLANHGLIGIVIMERQNSESLFINSWLISCRVLKRGMEEFIINKIIETAKQLGYKQVIGEYIPTSKNAMVADIYEQLGFTRKSKYSNSVRNCPCRRRTAKPYSLLRRAHWVASARLTRDLFPCQCRVETLYIFTADVKNFTKNKTYVKEK